MRRTVQDQAGLETANYVGEVFTIRTSSGRQVDYEIERAERRMQPLIDALKGTGLVQPLANCGLHYDDDPEGDFYPDKDHAGTMGAYVSFLPFPGVDLTVIERSIGEITGKFNGGRCQVLMKFYKDFISGDEYFYLIELSPFEGSHGNEKNNLEHAIDTVSKMICERESRDQDR